MRSTVKNVKRGFKKKIQIGNFLASLSLWMYIPYRANPLGTPLGLDQTLRHTNSSPITYFEIYRGEFLRRNR